jgi:hypothetical protein
MPPEDQFKIKGRAAEAVRKKRKELLYGALWLSEMWNEQINYSNG